MKQIVDGLIAGIGGQFAAKYIGAYGHPAAAVAVGMWKKNNVLTTEGARAVGAMIADQLPFIGGAGNVGGGAY